MKIMRELAHDDDCFTIGCARIFETNTADLVIIGRRLEDQAVLKEIEGKIGSNEMAVLVPRKLVDKVGSA